jgi:hypothetical protein
MARCINILLIILTVSCIALFGRDNQGQGLEHGMRAATNSSTNSLSLTWPPGLCDSKPESNLWLSPSVMIILGQNDFAPPISLPPPPNSIVSSILFEFAHQPFRINTGNVQLESLAVTRGAHGTGLCMERQSSAARDCQSAAFTACGQTPGSLRGVLPHGYFLLI